jgi:hypothetical protein
LFVLTLIVASMLATPTRSAEVMFILNNEFSQTEGDEAQIAIFEERNDTLDLWDNSRLQADPFDALDAANAADLVYIDESVSSSRADAVIDTTTPVLNNEQFAFDNWMMTDIPVGHGSPGAEDANFDLLVAGSHYGTEIQIVDDTHPIAKAARVANGLVQIYEGDGDELGGRIDWGMPGPEADIVAIVPGFDQFDPAAPIFVYEEGDRLIDGSEAPGMRIGFFLSDTNRGPDPGSDGAGPGREATLLTDSGKALLNAAIDYALGLADATPKLQAGDADQDLDFDQLDLVNVQVAAKYLTGQPATWGEGDWNGAPGGSQGSPPPGNGFFDQLDIIEALAPGHYLTGPYAAHGMRSDDRALAGQTATTGDLVYVPEPAALTILALGLLALFAGCRPVGRRC